ncbi:hypothetical protein AAA799N04_01736, partial [Marine Group I thaumarchaeote SCGC AAA799-N04]
MGNSIPKDFAALVIVVISFLRFSSVNVGSYFPSIILNALFSLIPVLKYVEFKISRKIFGSTFAFLTSVIPSDNASASIVICKFMAS